MDHISLYIKKYTELEANKKQTKKKIINIIKKITKITLNEGEITFSKGKIKIKKTGPEKAEIFIKRNQIEGEINGEENKNNIKIT